jgi:hypothetical protein
VLIHALVDLIQGDVDEINDSTVSWPDRHNSTNRKMSRAGICEGDIRHLFTTNRVAWSGALTVGV